MSIVFDDSRNLPPEELRPSVAETEVSQFTSPPRISTDFLPATKTSEPVHQRKWPVSLTTEVFVRKFKSRQDGLIFHPHGNNVQTLKHPSAYEELDGHGVTERTLVTEKKMYNIIPSASITLWERQGDPDKPHVIFFTGRTGHVADMGELPQEVKGYNRNTNLEFLRELAKNGAGFTVVTMRGYGNNKGKPGEAGFRKDIAVFVDDWMQRKDRVPADRLIVSGYSLGSANAAILASELTKRGEFPAVLGLANGPSSMVWRGKEYIDEFLRTTEHPKLKGLTIPEKVVKTILEHPFNTEERLAELKPLTHVCIGYSSHDELTNPSHSKQLAKTAKEHGLAVSEHCFEGCGHLNVPADQLSKLLLDAYAHSQSVEGKERTNDGLMTRMRDGVFVPQRFITVGRLNSADSAGHRL